jgi:hypothetical protein
MQDPFLKQVENETAEAMAILEGKRSVRDRIANLEIKKVEFPLHCLPHRIEAFVRAYMEVFHVPSDHYALAILTAAGGAVGNTARLDDRGSSHPPILNSVFVDVPGSGKTPTISTVLKPFVKIEGEHQRAYSAALAELKAERKLNKGGNDEEDPPVPTELLVGDFTLESLIDVMENNPRGIFAWADEIEGFISSMDKYRTGKGGDDKFWLSAYTGEAYKVNRRNRGRSVYIRSVFCPFMGGIQPPLLSSFGDDNRDSSGFLSRCLFSIPPLAKKQYYHDKRPSADHARFWEKAVRKMMSVQAAEVTRELDGKEVLMPHLVEMSTAAKNVYAGFINGLADQINALEDADIVVRSTLVKFETHCLRFALILHFLDWACEQSENHQAPTTDNEFADALANGYDPNVFIAKRTISEDAMIRATVISEYFMATGLEVVGRLASPVNSLKPEHQVWFAELPEEGTRKTAMELGKAAGMSTRTVDRLLRLKEFFTYRKARFEKVI